MSSKGTALVTGASSGIGAVYADRLAHRGFDLILVARSTDKLGSAAQRLSDVTGRNVSVLGADLCKRDDLRAVERVLREDSSITMLINNAGKGYATPLIASDVDAMEEMIDLNVTAVMRLTYAAAPAMQRRGHGAIINIASIAAIAPEILNGVYSGTKAFVLALSQTLRKELGDKIQVQCVLPGATATDFWEVAGVGVGNLPPAIVMSTEDMVDAALVGFDRRELVTIPALPDENQWHAFEAARQAMAPHLSRTSPAVRYLSKAHGA